MAKDHATGHERDYVTYDIESLKRDTDIVDVANAFGIESKGTGSAMQFIGPSPDHADRHFGSCKLTKDGNGIICYACTGANGKHKTWDCISLLTECFGYKFPEACAYLAEMTGNPSAYITYGEAANSTPVSKPKRLSEKEQEFLGLHNPKGVVYIPVNTLSEKVETLPPGYVCREHDTMLPDGTFQTEWLILKKEENLFAMDSGMFQEVVLAKCRERISAFYDMKREFIRPSYGRYAYLHIIQKMLQEEYDKDGGKTFSTKAMQKAMQYWIDFGMDIYRRYGGTEDSPKNIRDKFEKECSA